MSITTVSNNNNFNTNNKDFLIIKKISEMAEIVEKEKNWKEALPQLTALIPELKNPVCITNALRILQQIEELLDSDLSATDEDKDPSYTALTTEYFKHGMWDEAKHCFDKVKTIPVDVYYSQLIPKFEKRVDRKKIAECIEELLNSHLSEPSDKDPGYILLATEYFKLRVWDEDKRCLDKVKTIDVGVYYSQLVPIFEQQGNGKQFADCVDKVTKGAESPLLTAEALIRKGELIEAKNLAAHLTYPNDDAKTDFYSLLACNYILTDCSIHPENVTKRAYQVIEKTFLKKDILIIKQKILSLLQKFPDLILSTKIDIRPEIVSKLADALEDTAPNSILWKVTKKEKKSE